MPRTVTEVRQMAGGINAISAHLPWVQAALLPFYAKTGKKRLTKEDRAELRPKWDDLIACLQDTHSLYIPPPGAPLTLRVDAAAAGIGAVLLAHHIPDTANDDFKHFYAYLDGCVNLRIESDASNVIGLYSHKTNNDGDELSRFRAELTSLGVTREMLVHRPGEQQLTADWLSRARENIRPRKLSKVPVSVSVGSDSAGSDSNIAVVGATESESDSDDSFVTASESIILEPEHNIVGMMTTDDTTDTDDYDDDYWSDSDNPAPMNRRTIRELVRYQDQ
ncbi:hypothetical protein COEREDRAFT_12671 [Coemansia reversa NRRL 1564]|uniref:Uncharacterized protein n=1 Tax=Coemansia reversa (strain ATCC 12441 / NRRL 1564) TaxID=763665 RepID=A0A2G5B0G1_COERN|nr:hypothetical protein COEREDRAFT_12671 [Coemansia reversa NRRL 1564]|eukprot:PIA12518.1 hypothetical protein COEREDRAFT_12671 [Coemansia reversa NRRL 1564]